MGFFGDMSWLWLALRRNKPRRDPPPIWPAPPVVRASGGFIYKPTPSIPVQTYVTGTIAGGQSPRHATTWQCPSRHMTMTSSVPLSSLICYCGRSMIEMPPNPGRPTHQ